MLNNEQYRASRPDGGIMAVTAGPGTGKTKTIVEKIKNIVERGEYKPEEILLLTFSKKAAEEMKERIMKLDGEGYERVFTATFHSFCMKFLLRHKKEFSLISGLDKMPSIIDSKVKDSVINSMVCSDIHRFYGLPADTVKDMIFTGEKYSNTIGKISELADIGDQLKDIKASYNSYKVENSLVEFEDLIDHTVEILSQYDNLREELNNKYRYIIVDEFQDTSENNFNLLRLLVHPEKSNLLVVGDDDQGIYGFRDGQVEYLVNFKKYFNSAKTIALKINYRSHREIIHRAVKFISRNKVRTRKKLISHKGKGGVVKEILVKDFKEEVNAVNSILDSEYSDDKKIAILYRNNFIGDKIKQIFLCNSLNHYLDNIHFMTMHGSKGLEFDTVIIIGLRDNIIPSALSDMEEERRLFYVALTRAMKSLYLVSTINSDGSRPIFSKELDI